MLKKMGHPGKLVVVVIIIIITSSQKTSHQDFCATNILSYNYCILLFQIYSILIPVSKWRTFAVCWIFYRPDAFPILLLISQVSVVIMS